MARNPVRTRRSARAVLPELVGPPYSCPAVRWHLAGTGKITPGGSLSSTLPYAAASGRLRILRPHEIEATEALAPRILVQRFFEAGLGGRSLGLGIVDRRFGQLGDPISGCDCD